MISFAGVRRALAQAEHLELMSHEEMRALGACGHSGAATVRRALGVHMPELAKTRSPLEDRFLYFCERYEIPIPHPNFEIAGHEVDAVWPELRVAVELDGREEHGTPGAVVRDRRRELAIRSAGFNLIRYGSEQIDHGHIATAADLRATLNRGALPSASGG